MSSSWQWRVVAAAFGLGLTGQAIAQTPPPTASATATLSRAATAAPAATTSAGPAEPASSAAASAGPRQPPAEDEEDLPAGHPAIPRQQQDIYQPKPNSVTPDQALPAGVVEVLVLDADQRPVSGAKVVLEAQRETVSEGKSRGRLEGRTDERGRHRFSGLERGSAVSYRVIAERGPAQFYSEMFGLRGSGMRVLTHVYEPVTRFEAARAGFHAGLMLEVKESSILVNLTLQLINVGRTALVPADIRLPLPAGYSAFSSDGQVVEVDDLAQLTGTYPPGRSDISFRFRVPLEGDAQTLAIPLPPRVASTQVTVEAGPQMGLTVQGFPPAQRTRLRTGQRVLITALQGRTADASGQSLSITLTGLPAPHLATKLALLLALGLIAGGAWQLVQRRSDRRAALRGEQEDLQEARGVLLGELVALERCRQAGELIAEEYEQQRTALLDALTRIVVKLKAVQAEGAKEAQR